MSTITISANDRKMHYNMDASETEHALESARLELEYERALRDAERICEEERVRALRVQLLLLEDENDEVQENLETSEQDLHKSEDVNQELREQLADIDEQYQATQIELKACMRDIDHLHAEINALNVSSSDATKILSEKLALSRELAVLKPELEHLKSQSTTQQNLLSEKLALERELDSVQVDLETEKRTVQRLKSQSNSGDSALSEEIEELRKDLAKERKLLQKMEREKKSKQVNDKVTADAALTDEIEDLKRQLEEERRKIQKASLQSERQVAESNDSSEIIEDLRKELAKEKKNTQKAEREHLKKNTEWDGQKENLEAKLEAFRTKLRTTKEQLKEAQEEIERRDATKFAESTAATKARLNSSNTAANGVTNPRKRNVARFDPDMTIGTPGHGGPGMAKKARLTASSMGDKSTFSITPFLSRTTSILPEETPGEDEYEYANRAMRDRINAIAAEAESAVVSKKVSTTSAAKKKDTTSAPAKKKVNQPLKESTNPKANAVLKKSSSLDKVLEEDEDGVANMQNPKKTTVEQSKETDASQQKKKPLNVRKNIFEDSDAEENANSTSLGGKRKLFGGRAITGLGQNKMNLGMNKLGAGKPKMLAEFSPLKKDKRAANASLLV